MHEACLIKDHSALSSWAHLVLSYFATRISLIHSLFTLFACSCSLVFLLLEQVVLSWSCLLLYGACRFLQWTQLLSTWKGVILFVAGLTLVTGIMHIFVLFSQSERSSSARAARNRVKKDWGTPNSLLDQLCRHRCDGKKKFSVLVLYRNWNFVWQELSSPNLFLYLYDTIVDLFLVQQKLVHELIELVDWICQKWQTKKKVLYCFI